MKKSILLAFFYLLFLCISKGQTSNADSLLLATSLQKAEGIYNKVMLENLSLFNGREYVTSDNRIQGHPFFESEDMEEGTVIYYENKYDKIPIQYDTYTDELITEHYNGVYDIILNGRYVSQFNLLGHTYIRVEKDTSQHTVPKTGFYDLLLNEDVKVFAKRRKIIFEEIRDKSVYREYQSTNQFFIKVDKGYFPVKSKKSVLKVFETHKKEVNKVLKKNKIKYRKNKEQAIILMAAEYNKLAHNE